MSILTKPDILSAIRDSSIQVWKDDHQQLESELTVGPNSLDVHLHSHLKVYASYDVNGVHTPIDAYVANKTADVHIHSEGLVLRPHVLYLARTVECTYTPEHVPELGGRSSTGRLGLAIHQAAGKGDIGFHGTWTMGMSCVEPVRVYANMRIAQIWFFEPSTHLRVESKYSGRYQHQLDPTASRGNEYGPGTK